MRSKTLAIILGGGQGSRLSPLTQSRSKPAVPIAGKYRLVDIPISNCINSDIKRIFVLTQFNSASLNQHIKNTYHFSSFSTAFVDILAAEQTPDNPGWFQGTADAVRQCMTHFMNHEFDYALILSGDQLYQMDFNDMIEKHRQSGAEISIATLPVNAKDAPGFGIMKTDEDHLVTSFIEKPSADILHDWTSPVSEEMNNQGKHYLASMGIYIFNRDLLVKLMEDHSTTDFGKEIMPQSVGKYKMVSYQYEGYWTDIGNIDSFFEANMDLTNEIPQFNLFEKVKRIYTRARILPPSKFIGETRISKALIAEGCILHGCHIERSVIGIRSRIGKDSHVSNSYVMGCDYYQKLDEINHNRENKNISIGIGERSYLNNCIIDKNCRIGDDVKLNGGSHLPNQEHELFVVKEGIIVVKKNAKIPHGFTIGL